MAETSSPSPPCPWSHCLCSPLGTGSEGSVVWGWRGSLSPEAPNPCLRVLQAQPHPEPDRLASSHPHSWPPSPRLPFPSGVGISYLQLQPSLWHCLPFGSGRNDQRPLPCGGLFPRPLLPVPCLCLVVLHVLLSLRCKGGVLLRGETRLPWGSDNALQGVRGYPEIGADRVSGHMCAFQGLHGICQPLGGLACGHQIKPFSPDPHLPLQCLCHLCLPCHQPQTPATCTRSVTVP